LERGIPATHEIEYLKDGLVRISFPYFHSKNGKRKYAGFVQLQSYLNLQSKELPQLPFWLLLFSHLNMIFVALHRKHSTLLVLKLTP
jgi:hypothetical protein